MIHSDNLLPQSGVRIEFKVDSECMLHSLNVERLPKSILVKNSKEKMTIHLSQISKGYNLECFIGFVAKKEQAADHGTK